MILTDDSILKNTAFFLGKNKGKKVFVEHEVKIFLKSAGLSVPKGMLAGKDGHIPSSSLAYPLAAKVSSAKITSKSDTGGIRLGLKNDAELRKAVSELLKIKDAEGVLVEEMAREGIEVIIGGVLDRQFGAVVMFGIGGVFVEVFKDIAFALAPLKEEDALWLITQVKGYRLLEGFRGKPAVDKDALIKAILVVSEIISSGYVEEIDLNPVALYPKGAMVLDAKMKIFKRQER
ncbi:MAG: acyl-CoA synthetase [Nitrospirae bacterium CG_4_10_14_3_um_filter_44_29]|nr:acyl-CoA synthetase [Nitrospirota bacterium]PIV66346.1 MAG: acyl-CoA synthetase [Nitrospirae bacterium CG01_land_8_20_14_3_00_44_22]PIX88897.1 MAG: acyl-CoA synthetase [Nitrospirae bacterium CG_4_10_14_3_um_filter_44_29]